MKYTPKQRQAIAEVFAKVRRRMKRNTPWNSDRYKVSRYICDNIRELDCVGTKFAFEVIEERIKYKFSVDQWLCDEGYISADFLERGRYVMNSDECKQLHAYRMRWLAAMIKEFSK